MNTVQLKKGEELQQQITLAETELTLLLEHEHANTMKGGSTVILTHRSVSTVVIENDTGQIDEIIQDAIDRKRKEIAKLNREFAAL